MDVLNQLPSEIWENILSRLDKFSLCSASLTSKDFFRFIYGSSVVLKNYRLKVQDADNHDTRWTFYKVFSKNFRSLVFKLNQDLRLTLQKHQILQQLTNLVELVLDNVQYTGYIPTIKLPALKILDIRGSQAFRVVRFFEDKIMIEKLTVCVKTQHSNAVFGDDFLRWLYKQSRLKSLELHERSFSIFFNNINVSSVTFKLEKFSIQITEEKSELGLIQTNLSQFMTAQDEINEVMVTVKTILTPGVLNLIPISIVPAKSLQKLTLSGNMDRYRGKSTITDAEPAVNEAVEVFINNSGKYQNFVQYFPNLKEYRDESVSAFSFKTTVGLLHRNCHNLKALKVSFGWPYELDGSYFNSKKFSNLKDLELTWFVGKEEFWQTLITNCPAVESLSLHFFTLHSSSVKLMCSKWLNFKVMILGCGFYELNMFECLDYSDSFWKLTIHQSTFDQVKFDSYNYRVHIYQDWPKCNHKDINDFTSAVGESFTIGNIESFKDESEPNTSFYY